MRVYKEYPRDLHKAGGLTLRVHDDIAKHEALEVGWSLLPVLNGHVIDFDEPEPVADEAPEAETFKRKPGRPKKA